jgi:hypothetical protein
MCRILTCDAFVPFTIWNGRVVYALAEQPRGQDEEKLRALI